MKFRLLPVIACMFALRATADPSALPVMQTDSVIHLSKNTNRNQVHYAVKVDEDCQPLTKKPMAPYWRMLEKGENETARIMFWEQPGYGVTQPETVEQSGSGGSFDFNIRGVPSRIIRLETFDQDGQCGARAFTQINDREALFTRIEIDVSGWANVHRVEIFGIDVESGEPVNEITHQD